MYDSKIIGILGGGQLGRMISLAAARLGIKCHIYCPDDNFPASEVCYKTTIGDYSDIDKLKQWAGQVDIITWEFENIPWQSIKLLSEYCLVCPNYNSLYITQNRVREKSFLAEHQIATAKWHSISSYKDLEAKIADMHFPIVLKTAEDGYDGKGQAVIKSRGDIQSAWNSIFADNFSVDNPIAIIEEFIDFDHEISVIVARNSKGQYCYWPAGQNIHQNHILSQTIIPANISSVQEEQAIKTAVKIANLLDITGILAVEMFVRDNPHDGKQILVNELAPRPHNSGHWTMDGAVTCQFEQLVRAICGFPFGSTQARCSTMMLNLIGYEVEKWTEYAADKNCKIHLYGKSDIREGRKMGHVNILGYDE